MTIIYNNNIEKSNYYLIFQECINNFFYIVSCGIKYI